MIYLRLFENHTAYEAKKDSLPTPCVSYDYEHVHIATPAVTPSMEFVDLGLSVKWATYNLGATKPEEYGNYYAWAETEGYTDATSRSFLSEYYKWIDDPNVPTFTKYNTTDNLTEIVKDSDDAAYVLDSSLRMPTNAEIRELTGLTHTEKTINGIKGVIFTATNGNSIFIPYGGYAYESNIQDIGDAGFIWSSNRFVSDCQQAYYLGCYAGETPFLASNLRYLGYNIRPVCE